MTTHATKMLETRTARLEQTVEELEALQRIINGAVTCPKCGSASVVPVRCEEWTGDYYMWCTGCDHESKAQGTMLSAVELWARNGV